jgi:hypothetical protein
MNYYDPHNPSELDLTLYFRARDGRMWPVLGAQYFVVGPADTATFYDADGRVVRSTSRACGVYVAHRNASIMADFKPADAAEHTPPHMRNR